MTIEGIVTHCWLKLGEDPLFLPPDEPAPAGWERAPFFDRADASYPLTCVDRGVAESPRYVGPVPSTHVPERGVLRRARRHPVRELAQLERLPARIVNYVALAVQMDERIEEHAWGQQGATLVSLRPGALAAIVAWADEFLVLNVFEAEPMDVPGTRQTVNEGETR